MAAGDTAATASAAHPTDRTTIAASHRSRRRAAVARPGRSRAGQPGSGNGCACAPHGQYGRISRSHARSPRTSSQSCRLIAGLIRMRSTSGRFAARWSSGDLIRRPARRIDAAPVRAHYPRPVPPSHASTAVERALRRRTSRPTSTSRPSLMAEMPQPRHRSAAWPRDVLDVEIAQSGRTRLLAQGFDARDGRRRAPKRTPRQVDGLESGPLGRQTHRAGNATGGLTADDVQRGRGRRIGSGRHSQRRRRYQ